MQYTINQLYEHLYQKTDAVYDTFKNFFGEGNVDLQKIDEVFFKKSLELQMGDEGIEVEKGNFDASYEIPNILLTKIEDLFSSRKSTIYVHWDRVTITNEHDKSIEIQDLYAKIEVTLEGRIPYENRGFLLNRATYSKEQFVSNFLHSHIHHIPKGNFTRFMEPCLGTGPIGNTIGTLKNEYDEITWLLFCQELSMYVTVESLAGTPWKYLEQVGGSSRLLSHVGYRIGGSKNAFLKHFTNDKLREFTEYYLKHGHLALSYRGEKFICGMPYFEFIIDISNCFIDYYNEHLRQTEIQLQRCYDSKLLWKVLVKDNQFYKNAATNTNNRELDQYRNKLVLRFKGKDILTTITEEDTSDATITTIIDQDLAMFMLNNILKIINFRYKNEHNSKPKDKSPSPSYKRVLYI